MVKYSIAKSVLPEWSEDSYSVKKKEAIKKVFK